MFELKAIVEAKYPERRLEALEELESAVRAEFGKYIIDVSRWAYATHPVDDEFLVSINFTHRNPSAVRIFVSTTLGLRVVSLVNLVTQKTYPLNRKQRRRMSHKTKAGRK